MVQKCAACDAASLYNCGFLVRIKIVECFFKRLKIMFGESYASSVTVALYRLKFFSLRVNLPIARAFIFMKINPNTAALPLPHVNQF